MNMNDTDFGAMKHNGIDAWDCRCEFEFPHPKTRHFAVHLWAPETGPSDAQRFGFRELKTRYRELWPDIANGIVSVHPTLKSINELNSSTSEWVAVHISEHAEDSIELVYYLVLPDEGSRGYFAPLDGWNIREVIVAE
jgi:hypothetical protein